MATAHNRQNRKSPEQWSEKEISEWFSRGEWKEKWIARPDESIDQREFAIHYQRNPERWKKAFSFLANEKLAELKPGRYELEGADLFINIDEYATKNEEDARFEAHQHYADIQYLIAGEEKIGVMPLESATVTLPYNRKKDVVFLSAEESNYRLATPAIFFIFFPHDAHRPCVKSNKNSPVKKAVVKIRLPLVPLPLFCPSFATRG